MCVYTCVVCKLSWPNSSFTARRLAPLSDGSVLDSSKSFPLTWRISKKKVLTSSHRRLILTSNGNNRQGLTRMLSIEEVSQILGLAKRTIYRYVKTGELKAYKFGRDLKFKQEDVKTFIEAHEKK